MNHFFWLSNALFMAFHSVVCLAKYEDRYLTTEEIAKALNVSFNHLQKVHQRLVQSGLIKSVRGPHGGFALNRPPNEITLHEVYVAIEGKYSPNHCFLNDNADDPSPCILGDFLSDVDQMIQSHLKTVTLDKFCSVSRMDKMIENL